MRFGVFLLAGRFPGQDDAAALRRASEAVVAAERAGFDDAWIAEHHFMGYGTCPSAITFAGHALGRTRRLVVGTAVTVLSTTHPVALAEQAALLDQLSAGRFHLGVGRGGPWVDLEVFGTGLERYESGFAEGLDLLLRALADDHVGSASQTFTFRQVPMVPEPRTKPRPPVTVACTSPPTVELAAERGLPMLLGMHIGDDEKAEIVAAYAKAARSAGRDPRSVSHISAVVAQVADSRADAKRKLMAALPQWQAAGFAAHETVDGRPRPSRDPVAYAERLCGLHPLGDPGQCAMHLLRSAERTGIDHVMMMVEGSGSHSGTLANIERLSREVLPLLH